MGSISSRPKVPQPQIIFVPGPTSSGASGSSGSSTSSASSGGSAGAGSTGSVDSQGGGGAESESPAAIRRNNLLRRDRGRFGTVLTGFRGFLSPGRLGTPPAQGQGQGQEQGQGLGRKQLLGE